MNTHRPSGEVESGFEPDKFLQEKSNFSSTAEKMDFFKEKFSEQISAASRLLDQVPDRVFSGETPEAIFASLENDPDFLLLSQDQKFKLKEGVYKLDSTQFRVDDFFKDAESEPLDVKLGMLLNNESLHSVDYDLKGSVSIEKKGYFVQITLDHTDDYDFLKSRGESARIEDYDNNSSGFKIMNHRYDFPVIVIPKELKKGPVSIEQMQKTINHEARHARNSFLIQGEKTIPLENAKDEIIAYIEENKTLGEIEEILTRSDSIYTYGLEGEAWEEHALAVKKMIKDLAELNLETVNLDALAMSPSRLWAYTLENQNSSDSENVKAIERGYFEEESLRISKVLLNHFNQEIESGAINSFKEFIDNYSQELQRKEVLADEILQLVYSKHFMYKQNTALDGHFSCLSGDPSFVLSTTQSIFDSFNREKVKMMTDYADKVKRKNLVANGYPNNISEVLGFLSEREMGFYAGLYSPLLKSGDPKHKRYYDLLSSSVGKEVEIDGRILTDFLEKINFVLGTVGDQGNNK